MDSDTSKPGSWATAGARGRPGLVPPDPSAVTIYVVDDDQNVVDTIGRYLASLGYKVETFLDPIVARAQIEESPPSLLLTDKDMPTVDGLELAQMAMETDPDTPVLILTGSTDVESAAESFRIGIVEYLLKPADLKRVEDAVSRALWSRGSRIYQREMEGWLRWEAESQAQAAKEKTEEAEAVTVAAVSALVRLLEANSPHLVGHSQAVSEVAAGTAMAMELSAEEVKEIRIAGLLHDIGMIAVPNQLAEKADPLSQGELDEVKAHCRLAKEILEPFPHLGRVAEYVLLHHERWNGSGYPNGLAGNQIPMGAQVVGLADSYQKLVEPRPNQETQAPGEALGMLRGTEGSWYSSEVLDALEAALPTLG